MTPALRWLPNVGYLPQISLSITRLPTLAQRTLQPSQHVCCSSGTLPSFAPSPNSDGSCASYTASGNSCSAIAVTYSLSLDQLNNYNSDTWGWGGCNDILIGTIICLSSGTPPMPPAVCGPTVPGTEAHRWDHDNRPQSMPAKCLLQYLGPV